MLTMKSARQITVHFDPEGHIVNLSSLVDSKLAD